MSNNHKCCKIYLVYINVSPKGYRGGARFIVPNGKSNSPPKACPEKTKGRPKVRATKGQAYYHIFPYRASSDFLMFGSIPRSEYFLLSMP